MQSRAIKLPNERTQYLSLLLALSSFTIPLTYRYQPFHLDPKVESWKQERKSEPCAAHHSLQSQLLHPSKFNSPLSLLRLRISRTRTANAATNQIRPAPSPSAKVVRVSECFARARRKKRRRRASSGLWAIAAGVEADGAGAQVGAGGSVVVEERDVAAGDDAGALAAAGADDLVVSFPQHA